MMPTDDHTEQPESHAGGQSTILKTRPADPKVGRLPPWKVLLHNDDVNDRHYVVETIQEITTLNRHEAMQRMLEADKTGTALLLTTNREHAELLAEQFASKKLTVTIEPED